MHNFVSYPGLWRRKSNSIETPDRPVDDAIIAHDDGRHKYVVMKKTSAKQKRERALRAAERASEDAVAMSRLEEEKKAWEEEGRVAAAAATVTCKGKGGVASVSPDNGQKKEYPCTVPLPVAVAGADGDVEMSDGRAGKDTVVGEDGLDEDDAKGGRGVRSPPSEETKTGQEKEIKEEDQVCNGRS